LLERAPRRRLGIDLRWDEISIAGHPVVRTPNIDRVGKGRRVFPKRFCDDTVVLAEPSMRSDRAIR